MAKISDMLIAATQAGTPNELLGQRGDTERRRWHLLLAGMGAFVVLSAIILSIRVGSLVRCYEYFETSGMEPLRVYGIWKLHRGLPLYEWPGPYYTILLYNFLFFYLYAALLWIVGAFDARILLYGKVVTLTFAAIGALYQWALMNRLVHPQARGATSAFLGLMSCCFWLGPGFMSWWALSIRPDVPSLAFCVAALYHVLSAPEGRGRTARLVLASVLFFLAWAFKQTSISMLAGVGVYCLVTRSWRDLLRLAMPFVALTAAAFLIGGARYRLNIITAPLFLSSPLSRTLENAAHEFWAHLFLNAFVWLFWLASLPSVLAAGRSIVAGRADLATTTATPQEAPTNGRDPLVLIAAVSAVAFLMGFYSLGAEGASRNHIFEAYAMLLAFSCMTMVNVVRAGRTTAFWTGLVLLAAMIAYPAAQLARPDRIGRLTLASDAELRTRQQFAAFVGTLPKPLFAEDYLMFALPWHASNNEYPSVLIDSYIYYQSEHLLEGGGVRGLIRERSFGSLILPRGSQFMPIAQGAGYRLAPLPVQLDSFHFLYLRD